MHGEGASTADYNDGKAAIGTGPFRYVSWSRGDKLVLARNDSWWRGPVAWDHVTFRYIKNAASRLAALLAGDVDLIDQVSVQDVARVQGDQRFTVATGVSDDIVGFMFDQQDRSSPKIAGNDGAPLPANPFRDRRVREAVNLAIDRSAIRDRIMNGQSSPQNQVHDAGAVWLRSRSAAAALRPGGGQTTAGGSRLSGRLPTRRSTARTIASSTTRRSARPSRKCSRASASPPRRR